MVDLRADLQSPYGAGDRATMLAPVNLPRLGDPLLVVCRGADRLVP
jgi:hypothetical protein